MAEQILTDRDDGGTLTAKVGDVLEIHLAENATAGYRWQLEHCDTARLTLLENAAAYPASGAGSAVGSGGIARFRFAVTAVGTTTLTLQYTRSWEKAAEAPQRFSVTIEAGA